ncbi:MAG: hypothetical protein U1E78_01665 [Gammaproteobacteria bacterium]
MLNLSLPTKIGDIAPILNTIATSNCRGLSTAANYLLKNLSDKTSREFFTEHYNEVAHMLISLYNHHDPNTLWFIEECLPAIQAILPTQYPNQTLKRGEKLMFELPHQPKPPLTVLYSMQEIQFEPTASENDSTESLKKDKHCCHLL